MSRLSQRIVPWYSTNVFIASLLSLATIAAYERVVECDFVNFDDKTYVADNPHVQSGLTVQNLLWALTTTQSANWHPLTWLTLQLDSVVFERQPGGYHLTNLLIHAANTVLLFFVLRRMTQAPWRSALVAALFGLHPVHVESVAWVFERKDVLSTLFWILTIGAYARFTEQPSYGRYSLVILSFLFGILAKPMVVTLPCVLWLLDYWPLQLLSNTAGRTPRPEVRKTSKAKREPAPWTVSNLVWLKLPLLALSAAYSAITLYAQREAIRATDYYPLLNRIGNAAAACVGYIGMMFWPANLSVFYPYDRNPNVLWQAGAALILLCTTVGVLLRRERRYLPVGWLWYLGTLVPVIGIIQVGQQALADRYAYIPSIGLFIAIVWGLADLSAEFRVPGWIRVGMAGTALLGCIYLTHLQVEHWRNSWTLWEHAMRANPSNYLAHASLASLYADRGSDEDDKAAILHFRLAIQKNPYDRKSYADLGQVLHRQLLRGHNQRMTELVELWKEGLRIRPDQEDWHHNLGLLLIEKGEYEEGIGHLREAIRLKPDLALTHLALGTVLEKRGEQKEAQEHLEKAYSLMPELRSRPPQ
jgi:tetratricopeptide (TPR) repeat protein